MRNINLTYGRKKRINMRKLICFVLRKHKLGNEWRFGPTHAREKTCSRCGKIKGHGTLLSGGWYPIEEL